MGIPKFFKWLTRRYPLILQSVKYEEDVPPVGKQYSLSDFADNLYLDINGIVHNCIHGNDKSKHEKISQLDDLEEVWANIMRALDEIVHTVKPRKVILLAVDGVAPRAKMNQQRERRFRSAKDAAELRANLAAAGKTVPEVFDTNQISPGTDFMHELGRQLEWFVKYKLNTDPLYQQCRQVILSDSSVPGEGEHKMLDFIRNARGREDYDPNTRHCFYGADADLIMLSLLTHEPHFMIIREEHVVRKSKHGGVQRIDIERTANYQLIHISLLREYFLLEYRTLQPQMRMRFDVERIIDDFVFFCFFIGNDFLPSLSALDISEGSLDHLINFYKKYLPQATDYITDNGLIHWDRAEAFIALLGKYEHQVFVNRVKTIQKQYADSRNIMTFGDDLNAQIGKLTAGDRTKSLQESLQNKVKQKKVEKCKQLHQNKKQKKYKKFLLLKRFEELDPDEGESVPAAKRAFRMKQMQKFQGLMKIQLEQEEATAEIDKMSLTELVGDLKEQYLSDLNPEEIPNSEISDVSEGELEAEEAKLQMQKSASRADDTERAIESNHTFMLDFVNTYKQDSNLAKRNYYEAKLNFDVNEPKGKRDLHKLLYRYLEGLQWVLFYYYRGAQHWRWYYPYHYAPMISDLGSNIVADFLNGQTTITEFRTDTNCNADRNPYTPFQQLLCILPVKSMRKFLPAPYADLASGQFAKYFPDKFVIDLNGRTLPWEAVILIPFVDEDLFLGAEQELYAAGKLVLTDRERTRNVTSFNYPSYSFDRRATGGTLASSLKTMRSLDNNKSVRVICEDYICCGTASFSAKLLPGARCPQPDFPSLHWLQVQDLEFRDVFVQKVGFKQALAKIPKCKEDYSPADFEAYIHALCQSQRPELYVDFPWQIEASPLCFEDQHHIYSVYHDGATGMQVAKSRNPKSEDELRHQGRMLANDLEKRGFLVDVEKTNAFVQYNTLNANEYDENQDCVFKLFKEEAVWLPLSMVMKKRDPSHYLDINARVDTPHGRIRTNQPAIIFHQDYFGVVGRVKAKNVQRAAASVAVDAKAESAKLHHPFLAENFLRREFTALKADGGKLAEKGSKKMPSAEAAQVVQDVAAKLTAKRYFGDQEIEVVLGLKKGVVNRLTSSFLVAFDEPGKDERQVIDLGLNLKNFSKKVHVAEYVRFIAPGGAANTIYDEFNHDRGARGSKHVRKHWEYSQDCFDCIKEYVTKFPEILDAIAANQKHNKGMNSLFDLYPKLSKADKTEGIAGARAITAWIEALPISKLPYVEMGFDALDSALITRLQEHSRFVSESYEPIQLNVGKTVQFQTLFLYQEMYPHWFAPTVARQRVTDFRVGNRVMNLNSTLRQYIPFGLRGTVVGKTEDYVIVLFDEQFLHGSDVYGHCENYRGAKVYPIYLLNLSRAFAQLAKDAKNFNALKAFQERPRKGEAEFEDQMTPNEALQRKAMREAQEVPYQRDEGGKDEKGEVPVKEASENEEERKRSDKAEFDVDAPAFRPKAQQAVWQPKAEQVGRFSAGEFGVAEKREPIKRERNYGLGQPKAKMPGMPQQHMPKMPAQTMPTAPLKEIGTKAEPVARLPSEQADGEKPQAGKFLFKPLDLNIKGVSGKREEEKKGPE